MNLTLRIKRVYLQAIASGEKRTEYREHKDFYKRLLKRTPTTLTLHYQQRERVIVEVTRVDVIDTPKDFSSSTTPKCYAIRLGRVLQHIPA